MIALVGRMALRRTLEAIPIVLVVCSILFLLVHLMPGSPAIAVLGSQANPDSIAAFDHSVGLDQPLRAQYATYLVGLGRGDMGESWLSGAPVSSLVLPRLPITVTIALFALVLSLVAGVLIGVLAATRSKATDTAITVTSGIGVALPNFWVGVLFVLVFALWVPVFPATGWVPFTVSPVAWWTHLVLPVLSLAVIQVSAFARQTRAAVLSELSKDYVRSLRSRGFSRRRILWRHVLRNAAVPVITTIGISFVGMLGGAVIIEQVFAIPGIGLLTVQAANAHDLPILQGVVLLTALVVIGVNLLVDVLYVLVNPKMRTA